jgi:hypothetical protein
MESKQQTSTTGLYRPGLTISMAHVAANWQELGFPSSEVALLWDTIAEPATPPRARAACFQAIGQHMAPPLAATPTKESRRRFVMTQVAVTAPAAIWPRQMTTATGTRTREEKSGRKLQVVQCCPVQAQQLNP